MVDEAQEITPVSDFWRAEALMEEAGFEAAFFSLGAPLRRKVARNAASETEILMKMPRWAALSDEDRAICLHALRFSCAAGDLGQVGLRTMLARIAEAAPGEAGPRRAMVAFRAVRNYHPEDPEPELTATLARMRSAGVRHLKAADLIHVMQAGDDLSPADRFWYLEIALGAGRPDANNGVGEKGYGGPPEPETVRAAREEAGLTQAEAAQLVHATLNAWQKWESGDRKMQAATWELFQIKTGQLDSGA